MATDQQNGGKAVMMNIDRVTASRLGIAPSTVDNTLYDAYGQRQINTLYTQLNQYHVIFEAMPEFQADPSKLQSLYIQSNGSSGASGAGASTSFAASGSSSAGSNATTQAAKYTPASGALTPSTNALATTQPGSGSSSSTTASTSGTSSALSSRVPLSAFTQLTTISEPLSITHQGQFPSVTVSFNLGPNAALGDAITAIDKIQKNLNMPLSVQAGFQGTAASHLRIRFRTRHC